MSSTWWPLLEQLARDGAADLAGAGDGDAHHAPPDRRRTRDWTRARRAGSMQHVEEVVRLHHRLGVGDQPLAEAGDEGRRGRATRCSRRVTRCPTQPSPARTWASATLPDPSRHSSSTASGRMRRRIWSVCQATLATVGMPEALVDLGAARVVDAGDDVLDAEGLAGHPGGEDVGVVAAADRGEGVRALDPGLDEVVAVEADAGDGRAGEVGVQLAEARALLVDHRHGVTGLVQGVGERRPHAAAPHDDDVHESQTLHGATDVAPLAGTAPTTRPGGRRSRLVRVEFADVSMSDPPSACWSAVPSPASSSARPCCPSASRCRSSPPTRCRPTRTPPRRSCWSLSLGGMAFYSVRPVGRGDGRARVLRRGRLLPPERPRLPQRRRRLRGRDAPTSAPAPGVFVASALLVDYVLTVAVSISAAVANLASAVPAIGTHKTQWAVARSWSSRS